MNLDSPTKRNAGLKDEDGLLFPQNDVDAFDRQTLVGDYLPGTPTPPAGTGAIIVDVIDF